MKNLKNFLALVVSLIADALGEVARLLWRSTWLTGAIVVIAALVAMGMTAVGDDFLAVLIREGVA